MKILLTMIVKGDSEIDKLKVALASFMPYMDGLVLAQTGLNEKSVKVQKLVKKYKGHFLTVTPETNPEVYSKDKGEWFFSNFAAARNVTFKYADTLKGYDWYSWCDVDDVLLAGEELRKVATQAIDERVDSIFFTYWYSVVINDKGEYDENSVEIDHLRERLIRPRIFKWISRLHEVTVPIDGNYKAINNAYEYNRKTNRNCVWVHMTTRPEVMQKMERNIKILEMQARDEDHKDPRTILYLAKTYYDFQKPQYDDLAIMLIEKEYLFGEHPSGWNEERSHAWQYLGNLYTRKNNHEKAIYCFFEAIKEYPNNHLHYLYLAKEYAEIKKFEESNFFLDLALRMDPPKSRTTIGNPLEIKFMSASLKYNDAIRRQNIEEAIYWMEIRNKLGNLKEDDMLKGLKEMKKMNEAAKNVFEYAKWLKDTNHQDKARELLKALPQELGREQFAYFIANQVSSPKKWGDKTIAYYASWGSEHFEKWSPKNMESGIGGSETAVIELAKRWAKKGYDVTVFGDPREDAGDYEGVHYRPWYEINWNDEFNILILWRNPMILDTKPKAKKIIYDAHDVESNLNWTPERVKTVSKVVFKSKYHRSQVPNLPDDKAVVISNGINL